MATSLDPAAIAAILAKDDKKKARVSNPVDRTGLTYCNWCKGWYNEYHYGDIDDSEVST